VKVSKKIARQLAHTGNAIRRCLALPFSAVLAFSPHEMPVRFALRTGIRLTGALSGRGQGSARVAVGAVSTNSVYAAERTAGTQLSQVPLRTGFRPSLDPERERLQREPGVVRTRANLVLFSHTRRVLPVQTRTMACRSRSPAKISPVSVVLLVDGCKGEGSVSQHVVLSAAARHKTEGMMMIGLQRVAPADALRRMAQFLLAGLGKRAAMAAFTALCPATLPVIVEVVQRWQQRAVEAKKLMP